MNAVKANDYLESLRSIYHKESAVLQQLQRNKAEKENAVKCLLEERDQVELKRILVTDAATEAREQSRDVLQDMGTRALQFILGDNISLEIELKEQARHWIANFFTKEEEAEDYQIETDPAEEDGGGAADVVAISTQTAMLQLTGDYNVAPLFLDEPSKFVSKGHSEKVARFLSEISSHFERQTMMVTHDEYLSNVGDVAYLFKKIDGSTIATKLA
ncbi:hypothetical protein ACFVS2_21565 [Brevibacillus sp. NPDC058079]|uniref:hypothetical protein n=1 Tax=Brevibacillus sp. NPDC058079 TaxID=3346330 RepID=UPI0036E004CC